MMKRNRHITMRICSAVLAVCLLCNLLPVSVIAYAGDQDKPINVHWLPNKQTKDAIRDMELSISLTPSDDINAAMVEITLETDEAASLQWDADRIDEPQPEDPTDTYNTGDDTTTVYTTQSDTAALSIAQSPIQRTSNEQPQAVLVNKADNSGAVLRILLSGTANYEKTLVFSAAGSDQTVDVSQSDIRMKTYGNADALPDINTEPLLTGNTGDNNFAFEGKTFTVLRVLPEELAITAETGTVDLDSEGGNKDISYSISIQNPFAGENPDSTSSYPFTLTWPSTLSRPSGKLTTSGPTNGIYTISCDTTPLAVLSGVPNGASISNVTATESGLVFQLTPPSGATSCDLQLTVKGDAFERSSAAFTEQMILSAVNSENESISASVTVQAGKTLLPGEEAGHTIRVDSSGTLSQTVAWADNEDEETMRPEYGREDGQYYPHIFFTINGVRTELTEETLKNVGLTDWPKIQGTPNGFTLSDLPTKITDSDGFGNDKQYTVSWSVEPPDTPPTHYAFVEVTEDNKDQYPSVDKTGWYYMLQGTFDFTVDIKKGQDKTITKEQVYSILSNFEFEWSYGLDGYGQDSIVEMIQNGIATLSIDKGKVTVSGLWKYNLDGSPIEFKVTELPDEGQSSDYQLTSDELSGSDLLPDEEDWLQISYDNSKVPNHGQDTTAVYNGGTLCLSLSGEIDFHAQKRWLDSAPDSKLETRPDVTFTLWRYREGQGYKTAAPVTDDHSQQYTCISDAEEVEPIKDTAQGYYYYPVNFKSEDAEILFPKYDPDGYAYVYGVKEAVSYNTGDNNYETLYGIVGQDDEIVAGSDVLPYEGDRTAGDTMLYNGGTLSNRLENSTQVIAKKTWEAAAYQAAFEDVAVELTLQSKLKDGAADWADVKNDDGSNFTRYLYNFTDDRLTETYALSMPRYDAQGRELEYRWVETAVYQGVNGTTEGQVREEIANLPRIEINANGEFTLKQGIDGTTEDVTYISTIEDDGTIVNRIRDTIDYQVIKTWGEPVTKKAVTFNLFRIASGSADFDLSTPYVSFSYDEKGNLDLSAAVLPEGVTITQDMKEDAPDEINPWHATVHGLPRFDENGRPYEYVLLEQTGYPTYTTERKTNGDYMTTVFNGPGTGAIPILVRKVWLDDGDDLHREPVTFTVYSRRDDTVLKAVTLGDDDNPGLWHEVIQIPITDSVQSVDDLYVVETSVGSHAVDHHLANATGEDKYNALYNTGKGDNGEVFDVTTLNHRYQVTYKFENDKSASGVEGTFTVTNRRLGNIDLTVTKNWVDGDHDKMVAAIEAELKKIAEEPNGKKLALVFQLQFADASKTEDTTDDDGWGISYTGFDNQADTVQVGGLDGEKVNIYSGYTDESKTTYADKASSEQVIIGVNENGDVEIKQEARFFGLPKYDANGKSVEYTVEELWLDVTNSTGTIRPKPVENMAADYPDLWALWKDYQISYGTPVIEGNSTHTKDQQSLEVTNSRSQTKDVTWTKIWKDDFTYNSNQRPDIYLDIYAVSHTSETEQRITRVQKDVKWEATGNDANEWTVTLSDVRKYDDLGYEIKYYAVELSVVAIGDYDYQAVIYSLADGTELGNRDTPAANAGSNVLDLLNPDYSVSGFNPEDLDIGEFTPGATPKYPRYALIEGGIFTNTLAEEYSIEGMKYWTSLPSGWKDAELPSVTFNVYRNSADTNFTPVADNHVASLTIESKQWQELKNGLSYRYLIQYEGVNTLSKNKDTGKLICTGEPGQSHLDRYDEDGKLYTYKVTETVNWADTSIPEEDRVFKQTNSAFTFTNEYNPTEGSIKVKKFLYLPMKEDGTPEAYPAVTFKLTRQVQLNGTYVADASFGTKTQTISSKQVQDAYEKLSADEKQAGCITAYALFTNLDLYAPNGTVYKYTVTEDKSQLNGFDTWAAEGDVAVNAVTEKGTVITDLAPWKFTDTDVQQAQATFKNQQPDDQQEYENGFTATKVWDDNNNAYGFRPTSDKFKELLEHVERNDAGNVTWSALKRTAATQTSQGNSITEYLIPNEDFTITVTQSTADSKSYSIVITPANGTAFDLYAPNGMPWTYSFSEPVVSGKNRLQIDFDDLNAPENNIYAPPVGTGGKWKTEIKPVTGTAVQNTDFGSLTNTTHMSYRFNKQWEDADGDPILKNYLGDDFELTVAFQLQVSADGMQTWENASSSVYFNNLDTTAITVTGAQQGTSWDTATITGTVTASAWNAGGTFTNLPTVIKNNDGTYTLLQYRVIETSVSYNGQTQQISWNDDTDNYFAVTDPGLVVGAFLDRTTIGLSSSINILDTSEVSVTKVWIDESNKYNTRPGVQVPMTWTAWYVLQRSSDGGTTWNNVDVARLFGGNGNHKDQAGTGERWEYTFLGLPTVDYSNGNQTYIYRVRELQPKDGGYTLDTIADSDIVAEGETYNPAGATQGSSYTTTYQQDPEKYWTVTNTLDLYEPEGEVQEVKVVKAWAVPDDDSSAKPSISFQLQYREAGQTKWNMAPFANAEQTVSETNGWTVTWTGLPNIINGKEVTYQVVEQTTDGWVQLDKVITQGNEEGQYISTFTNTLTRDFTVEKKWNPTDQTNKPAVTLGLYRTTNANDVSTTKGTPVPVDEMDSTKGIRTVVLDGTVDTGSSLEKTAWHATFTALPKYDKDSNLYYYYAMELDADGNPLANGSVITLGGTGYVVSYATTDGNTAAVTNTPAIGLTGTKTWKDDNNKDGNRPTSLTLILERKIATQTSWDEVTGVTPTWTGTDTDTWTYSFTDLPQYAPDGSIYTYRVRESVPGGYELENQSGTEDGVVAADSNGRYHFTNVRIGTVTLHVTKKWTEGAAANRPADIQLKLERKTVNQADNAWTDVTNMYQSSEWVTGSDTWTLTYDNLPQFNGSGVRYEYRVTEDGVPVDYEVKNSTNTDPTKPYELENIQKGALEISKEVSGNRGETDRAFHFTITLTGTSLAGTKADDVTGQYTAVYTLQGDTTVHTTTIAFTNGKSAEFTLKHDESLTIQGLPAGLGYQVVETEENQDGYSTHGSGWSGNIPVGDTAHAAFENYRNSSPSNQTNISGTKTWIDDNNADGTRPASIELILYRSVDGGTETEVSATPVWTKDGNVWTYRYTGLPKYDSSGKAYTYRVAEVVPDGYQAQYDGLDIVNRKEDPGAFGSLRISKQVAGEKADRNREFSFKVTLSDKTISGTYGDLTFTEGVATFTLKHGQSLTATSLPAGLTYKVDETAVEGYTTNVVNPTGVIAGEGMVEVRFTNTWEPGEDPDPDEPGDAPDEPDDKPDEPDDKPDKPDSNTPDDGDKDGGVRTGDTAHPGLLAALTALFASGLLLMLHLGRKRRNGKKNG